MSPGAEIGVRLRGARQSRGYSLRSVAQALGVSASLISQVETGKTQPSVATLYALASLLSVSVDELLGLEAERIASVSPTSGPGFAIQRGADNPAIEMENGVRWERLAVGKNGPADALLVTYQPNARSSLEGKLMRHGGFEYAYILEGVVSLQLEFDTYHLARGDSLHFDSATPHMFSNAGSVPAIGVWFVVGRRDAAPSLLRKAEQERPGNLPANSAVEVLQRLDTLNGP